MSSIFNALFRSVSNATTSTSPPNKTDVSPPPPSGTDIPPSDGAVADPTPTKAAFFPPSPYSPGDGDVSYMTDPSPPDILIPAEIPYIYRRQLAAQAEAEGTPIKGRFLQPSTRGQGVSIRDPADRGYVPKAKSTQLSEWRKEQIRRQNPPRLMEPIIVKSISALHGPPNLPYARNPSGVDASIPDEPVVNSRDQGHSTSEYDTDILPVSAFHQPQATGRPASAAANHQTRPVTRVPYQQHIEMTHYPAGEVIIRAIPQAPETASSSKPDSKLTPSELLRSQIHTIPVIRSLDSIAEIAPPPGFPARTSSDIARKRTMSTSVPSASAVAAQKIVEDVDTYPTTPRYVAGSEASRVGSGSSQITITTKSIAEDEAAAAAAQATALGKADASANWRLKTPIRITAPAITSKKPIEIKYTPSSDRSDDAPIMTIDSLFEKFAPSTGLSPVNIKVNTPPQSDPAVKEISQTPLSTPKPDDLLCPSIPETLGHVSPSADVGQSSESMVEDLISFTSDPDENTTPTPTRISPSQKAAVKAKGTPGAGKLLMRGSGGKASKEIKEDMGGTPAVPVKAKAPLGAAKTIATATRSKSRAA